MTIESAIKSRWDGAGLDSSIAKLYPNKVPSSASPALPRAWYVLEDETPGVWPKSELENVQPLVIHVATNSFDTTRAHLKTIKAEFLNAQNAGTSALQLAAADGHVNNVRFMGSSTLGDADDDVTEGVIRFDIHYFEANTTPA